MSAAMSEELTRKLERRRNAHTRDVVGGARRELRKVLAGLVLHVGFAAAAFATYRVGGLSPVLPSVQPSLMVAGLAIVSLLAGVWAGAPAIEWRAMPDPPGQRCGRSR